MPENDGITDAEKRGRDIVNRPSHNPFSADKIASPGVFVDSGHSATHLPTLVNRWKNHGCVGQVVGPHGCGKSTLAIAIATAVGATTIRHCVIRSPRTTSPTGVPNFPTMDDRGISTEARFVDSITELMTGEPQTESGASGSNTDNESQVTCPREVWIVDGLTHWSLFHAWMIRRVGRQRDVCLLFTAHKPIPMVPVLAYLEPSLDQFCRIAKAMLRSTTPNLDREAHLGQEDFHRVFEHHHGDYRESLMELYDVFASRAKQQAAT